MGYPISVKADRVNRGKMGPFNQASAKQPAIFGKALAALAIVKSFALFAFVFALLLLS